MTALFYISGHGFGHASREVEIINALRRIAPETRIVIRTMVDAGLLARTIHGPFELHAGDVDSGVAQSSSVAHEDAATVERAVGFYRTFDDRVRADASRLAHAGVDVIVGDIPPLAFEVAAAIGVPSIAIANFTWDWIYETHPGMTDAAPWLLPRLRRAYGTATLALELPFAAGFDVFRRVERLPLVCRRPSRTRADVRAHFDIPADRPALLLSFGGYGMPDLDLERIDCRPAWTVVTTDRSARSGEAGRASGLVVIAEQAFADSGMRYEDLVAAVDVVVTKPGYGIIAECIAARTAMLYTSRGQFREYDLLVSEMPRYLRSAFISQSDLFGGRWRAALDRLIAQPDPPHAMALDGAEVAARRILRREA